MAFLGHEIQAGGKPCLLRFSVRMLVIGLLCLSSTAGLCAQPAVNEYDLKAVFLYKFANYIEWPALGPSDPISICTVGQHSFGDTLERLVRGQSANGHVFVVRHFRTAPEAKDCRIVFISEAKRKKLENILNTLAGHAVLTVGENEGFCASGGVINFELVDNKLRFTINVDAAERGGLKVSSRLLSLAKNVRDSGH